MTTPALDQSRSFFSPQTQARLHMIEMLMRFVGCAQPNPKAYRSHLLAMDDKELSRFYHEVMDQL